MEFCERNFIITTTAIVVDSNTSTAINLMNWNRRFQYVSDGFDDDTTSTTITVNFDQTTTIDRIALVEHNLKGYRLFYDGVTANAFTFTSTSDTTTSIYSSNSETSQFFRTTSIDCTSVSLQMDTTQEANTEKGLGILILSKLKYDFDRIPPASGYRPKLIPKQVIHKMSDGGSRRHRLNEKWRVELRFKDVDLTQKNAFKTIYDDSTSYIFAAFGTTTAWDNVFFDANWENDFNFEEYSENSTTQNFKGNIKLGERS